MNLFNDFRDHVLLAVEKLGLPAGLPLHAVAVEPPRDAAHGDLATNAAMVLAKPAGQNPRALAERLKPLLAKLPDVTGVEIAGPGFINLRLADSFWRRQLHAVLTAGSAYGDSAAGTGQNVNVEYVSANPTGPLHVGHCRGAVFGDALAALLEKAGYAVAREYYINDAGAQVDVLAESAYLRYREQRGEKIEIPEGFYPGDYLVEVGAMVSARDGDKHMDTKSSLVHQMFRHDAIAMMMDRIREDLEALGIRQDVFTSERELHQNGKVQRAVDALAAKGLIYEGVLEPPKGKKPDDWEPRPQTLFKASEFGDDVDRPLKKSDGSWTYFAADIAYHYDKIERGYLRMIDVWGADHGGYVTRMKAAVKAISGGAADLDVKICQLVNLLDGGQPVKMSKRSGSFVTLREVVDEVGKDVVRFIMLTRKNDAALEFDFKKVTEQSKDNPVFYVQYAHARIRSVQRKAGQAVNPAASLDALVHPAELGLIKLLATWPRVVEAAAEAHEPHRVAFYLYDLASSFHALWNLGNDDPSLRFVRDGEPGLTAARLALLEGVAIVIASGLKVLGVTPAEEMR